MAKDAGRGVGRLEHRDEPCARRSGGTPGRRARTHVASGPPTASPGSCGTPSRPTATRRASRRWLTPGRAAHSRPTGGPARRGTRGRRGAPPVRPCAVPSSSGSSLALCRQTRRGARSCSHVSGTARSHRPGIRTAGTRGTHPRRSAAARHHHGAVAVPRHAYQLPRPGKNIAPIACWNTYRLPSPPNAKSMIR
jgi:hypothetical protein